MGINLRTVKKEDVDIMYDWANDPVTRKNSFSEEPINYQTHVKWFNSCMDNRKHSNMGAYNKESPHSSGLTSFLINCTLKKEL